MEAPRRAHLAGSKQVAALNGLKNVGGDVGLGRKVSLCEGLLHFLHVNKAQSPFFSCGGRKSLEVSVRQGRQFYFSSQVATRGHADGQISTDPVYMVQVQV